MAAQQGSAQIDQLLAALEVIHDPKVSTEQRQRAQEVYFHSQSFMNIY